MCHPVGHKDQTIIRRGANLSEQRTGERQREEGVNGLANRNTSLLSQRRQSRVTVVDPDGLSRNLGSFRYHADVAYHATDILGYSDTLGTRKECHCKQIFAYSVTFW